MCSLAADSLTLRCDLENGLEAHDGDIGEVGDGGQISSFPMLSVLPFDPGASCPSLYARQPWFITHTLRWLVSRFFMSPRFSVLMLRSLSSAFFPVLPGS